MKYYIISGEASGDLHGSNLIKQLKQIDISANIRCWGGEMMQNAGATLVKHYKELAFMGFAEVIKNLPTILSNIRFCKEDIKKFSPDVLVLIDYPGFNLRIAEWGKQQGYKIVYYISPQVWAWKANRVKKMRLCIDKMMVILPFEKDYFKNTWQWDVDYVGHPLVEVIELYKKIHTFSPITNSPLPIIALLPGSRKQEIEKKLPLMLEVSKQFPNYHFIVAKAPGQEDSFYEPFLKAYKNVSTTNNETYSLLACSKAALVTSGTATLETALFGVPEVVCYKGSKISYEIGKRLIKIKYISLVNLIMDKLVVTELIQDELTTKNMVTELRLLLDDTSKQKQIAKDYTNLKSLLSESGNASAKAAKIINDFLLSNQVEKK